MSDEKFFDVNIKSYSNEFNFSVFRPASFDDCKDNSVMFLMKKYQHLLHSLEKVRNCLIFIDNEINVPNELNDKHLFIKTTNPRLEYCRFFKNHQIKNLPMINNFTFINNSFIGLKAKIDKSSIILPGCVIGDNVTIGKNVYIGAGVKILGKVVIGNNVVIRENTVIGANGLSTDRDYDDSNITMPQFGSVIIFDDVEIGSNCTIARGAIDSTLIGYGVKIDNNVFISHNVNIGDNTLIVGETIVFGSVKIGKNAYISGNCTIRNKIDIGDNATIGMGSVVTKDVPAMSTVLGNPARGR